MHPNLTAVASVSNVDPGVGVLLSDLRHSYGRVRTLNGMMTLEHNLVAAGSNGTSLEALIRPADQALRIGMPAHDAMSFTVGHRVVIIPRGDSTLAGNSNAALQEEDAA